MDAAGICVPQNILKAILDGRVTKLPKNQFEETL